MFEYVCVSGTKEGRLVPVFLPLLCFVFLKKTELDIFSPCLTMCIIRDPGGKVGTSLLASFLVLPPFNINKD